MKAAGRLLPWLLAALIVPAAHGAALPPIIESQPIGGGVPAQPGVAGQPARAAMTLEERVTRLERQAESQILMEIMSRLEALQIEVQELRGSAEMQGHKITGIEQRQRDLYLDIDRRMRQLESAPATAGAGAAPQAATTPPVPPAAAAPAIVAMPSASVPAPAARTGEDPVAERTAYQRSFDDLQAGRYPDAINGFRNFLARYPDGEFSANAQYWLGEAMYVTRQFPDAIAEFNKVLQLYPNSGKAPDAMLKLGFTYYELQDWNRAGETLSRVVDQYPGSTARQLAENRLHRMRLEGR